MLRRVISRKTPPSVRVPGYLFLIALLPFVPALIGCGQHPLGTVRVTPPARHLVAAFTPVPGTAASTPSSPPIALLPTPEGTPAPPEATATPVPTEAPPAETPAPSPSPEATAAPIPTVTPAPSHAVPVRVMIPRIGVNARVIPVGTAPDGAMDAPNNPFDVGWWDPGTRPGDFGSAVLGGHVDFAGFGAAVFWNLKTLRPGDSIRVVEADNTQLDFSVNAVETYSYSDTSIIDRVFRAADHQALNVITCTGTFDPRTHNYDKRVVVYATLAGS